MSGHSPQRHNLIMLGLLILLLSGCGSRPAQESADQSPSPEQISESLQAQLTLLLDSYGPVGGMALPEASVRSAYAEREYQPIWLSSEADRAALLDLVDLLERSGEHGLNPTHYHVDALKSYLDQPRSSTRQRAEMDVLATIAMERYAHDLSSGRYDPATIDSNWQLDVPNQEWQAVLSMASASDMVNALPGLAPQHPHYRNLQRWMAYYNELDRTREEIQIPPGQLLMRGSNEPRVAQLRQRLQQLGDLSAGARGADPARFDYELENAVKRFQARHQLVADGRAGSQTLAAMNTPVRERAQQIRWNLERWRWLPAELESDRIWVDLTGYTTEMHIRGNHYSMRSVIGKPDSMTRVFRGEMTYMEINPTWRVPQRLAREMILPIVQQDPNYLTRNNYEVYSGWHSGAERLDPDNIDWLAMAPEDLVYRFEQMPDPGNAMGQYKFMFPNRNAIYLHDTPEQRHFNQRMRAYSAGCVRLEDPSFFAETLLGNDSDALRTLDQARNNGATTVISLNDPLPIYLVYFTVMLDQHGLPEFREDIYDRDPLMAQAMELRANR